jgi:DNA-directed RNA polymerase specialized sigma24 family protein
MAVIPGDVDLTSSRLEPSEDLECQARKQQDGNETAFREFVELYQARIYRVALAILGSPRLADEIAIRAFVEARRTFSEAALDSSLFIQTHRIVVDECYRFVAGRWFRPFCFRSSAAKRRDLVNKLLAQLPREDRQVLLLSEIEGCSTAQISQLTGSDERPICTILFRTRQRLAGELRRESGKKRRLLRLAGLLVLLIASTVEASAVAARPWQQSGPCEVTPEQPYLGFDLRFHDEYGVVIPARLFDHTAGLLQVRVRVKPEAGIAEAVTLSRVFSIPEYATRKLMLVDGFDLGPGRYRVDLQMGDARVRECSAHWGIQTQPKDGLPGQPLTLEPNQIVERIAGPFDDEPSVDRAVGQPLGIKILLNLSPESSLESILNPLHTSVLMSIVRSIARQPEIGRFTLVAFNLRGQQIVYRQDNARNIDFAALGKALRVSGSGTIPYRVLRDKQSETRFAEKLLTDELGGEQHSADAIFIVGPKVTLDKKISLDALKSAGAAACPIFYLNYTPNPFNEPWRDTIGSALRAYKSSLAWNISFPRDMRAAMKELLSRIGEHAVAP